MNADERNAIIAEIMASLRQLGLVSEEETVTA